MGDGYGYPEAFSAATGIWQISKLMNAWEWETKESRRQSISRPMFPDGDGIPFIAEPSEKSAKETIEELKRNEPKLQNVIDAPWVKVDKLAAKGQRTA